MKLKRNSCPCVGTKRVGKILRTLVIVSNILYWFAGCSVLSIAIWIRFVDVGTKNYYSTFYPFDTGLYVVLVASVLFLVVSFVGTCAANTRNEMLLSLYIAVLVVVSTAEIISLIVFSTYYEQIETDFLSWYRDHFVKYSDEGNFHTDVVDHVQSKMKCCGLTRPGDYFRIFDNQTIPNSCMVKTKKSESILRPELHATGCLIKMEELATWLLRGWPIPFTASVMLLVQITGIVSAILLLQHIFTRRNTYEDGRDDGDESNLLDTKHRTRNEKDDHLSKLSSLQDLPRPRLYIVAKSSEQSSYGFTITYDEERGCYLIPDVTPGSNAEHAGIPANSEVIEINGMLVEGVSDQWVQEKLNNPFDEIRLVLIDEETASVYRSQKVSVNLKNVEGVTEVGCEYRPRLCHLKKGTCGFGFHLLYLEDRKGEYIEEVAPGLNVGDRIIEVNNVNIENESSSEVVKRIRMSGDTVKLLVVDPKTDGYYRKKGVGVTASMTADYFSERISESAASPAKRNKKKKRDVNPRYCCLVKTAKQDYGLYVVIDNSRIGQVIRWVDCGGPADKAGLRIGDRIIEVNGHSVEYESHQRLISCISLSKTVSRLLVVDEEYDQMYKRNKPRLCHIFKEAGTFGFCICYKENMGGHYVKIVDEDGPAQRAGLQPQDRIVQINGLNVERDSHEDVLERLRSCQTEVVLLVIDSLSSRHYRKIAEFKSLGLANTDYNETPEIEEPLFVHEVETRDESDVAKPSLNFVDSQSGRGEYATATIHKGEERVTREGHRTCTVTMADGEEQGFFLAMDENRQGQVLQRVQKGGAADRAGLRDGDRIVSVNNENIDELSHDQVVERIRKSGRTIVLTVVDQKLDEVNSKDRPYLFRIVKDDGGYGFYLWYDESGHYVEDIFIGSPADKSGMRSGDRIIEVNGVNVEQESHEDVFYRVKACKNVVTLLAVDKKTFRQYKSQNLPINVLKAEYNFSGSSSHRTNAQSSSASEKKTVTRDLEIRRRDGQDFGFNLAFSNSFMDDGCNGSHIVHWVEHGGPAYTAGLRDGDQIVAIDGNDVINEDHDELVTKLYQVGKFTVVLSVQYEDKDDDRDAHSIQITKVDNTFGFHLWFDENGHYIEDVTIGSAADTSGLKIGDRVLKVNGKDIEDAVHADVVDLVRKSGQSVDLFVFTIQSKHNHEMGHPVFLTIEKQRGTFGFAIAQDERGFHFDFVADGAAAANAGISIGDRLLEINGEQVADLTLDDVVRKIRASGAQVNLAVVSSMGKLRSATNVERRDGSSSSFNPTAFLDQLLSENETQSSGDNFTEAEGHGTDMRNEVEEKGGLAKRTDSFGHDNIAFVKDNHTVDKQDIVDETALPDKDPEGRYLEEKVSRAADQALKTRRRSEKKSWQDARPGTNRRIRNLTDIEKKLGPISGQARDRSGNTSLQTLMRERAEKKSANQNDRPFRLVTSTSLSQKWNFEQRDSRRPGETTLVTVEEKDAEDVGEELEQDISNSEEPYISNSEEP